MATRESRLRRCLSGIAALDSALAAPLRRRAQRASGPDSQSSANDDGYLLLEAIITISLITVIMTALASFFLTAVASTSQQRARQGAAQIADSSVGTLRAYNNGDLVAGRTAAAAASQFGAASSVVQPWLAVMTPAAKDSSDASTSPKVPMTAQAQLLNNINYSVTTYLGYCWVLKAATGATSCGLPTSTSATDYRYLRGVVAVTWPDVHCRNGTCTYLTATLLSNAPDPTFNLNQTPPSVPVVNDPGTQNSAVNDAVALQLTVQDGTGVPTYTWAQTGGTLPTGLALNSAGLISGTLSAQAVNRTVTVTVVVTDAFVRPSQALTFSWNILPALTITSSTSARADVSGAAITPLALTATGGTNSGFSWAASGLPPGLTLGSSTITGTPTTPGTYPSTITVTDSSGTRSVAASFNWTISYPPLAAATPSTRVSTIGQVITPFQLTASGGSGSYSWTGGASLPAGLSMNSSGLISGTPTGLGTTATVTVTDTVTGNTRTATFNWNVAAQPTVSAPANQVTTTGGSVAVPLSTSCPNSPCSYSLINGPAGLTISPSGVISGTITSAAQVFNNVTISVTDAAGANRTSGSFNWTVKAAPTIIAPIDQVTTTGGVVAGVTVTPTCPNSPCGYRLTNSPAGLTINSSGVISGTITSAAQVFNNVTVTITDQSGITASDTLVWTVKAVPTVTSPANLTASKGADYSRTLTYSCPNTPCSFTMAGGPTGLSISSSGVISGTITNAATTLTGIRITITDASGISAQSAAFSWTINNTRPTTTTPSATSKSRGSTVSPQALSFSCASVNCTITVAGAPAGIGLDNNTSGAVSSSLLCTSTSGTFYLRGTISASAATGNYPITITITDANGSSTTTSAVTWSVT